MAVFGWIRLSVLECKRQILLFCFQGGLKKGGSTHKFPAAHQKCYIGHSVGGDDDGNGVYDDGDNNDDVGEPDLGQSGQVRQQVAGLTIWSPWQQIIAFRKRPQNKIMGSF